jgi:hypothetical protein
MPLRIIPSVRPDAQLADVVTAFRQLSRLLDALLSGGLDSANLRLGSVSLGDGVGTAGNLKARYLSITTNATANAESVFAHGLGRVPTGYVVVKNGNGGVVYDGTTPWTDTYIYLRCTTASNEVRLLVW